jgi:hypothetical protein
VTATEQGNLDAALLAAGQAGVDQPGCEDPGTLAAALDVDLSGSPLTNTLPIRRLGMLDAVDLATSAPPTGVRHTVEVAWILVPSLEVVAASQTYQVQGAGQIRFTSGSFAADIRVDERGYVSHYPDLVERA